MYCVIFLLLSLTFHGLGRANSAMFSNMVASKQCLCSFRYSVHIPKYTGKYLCRRIFHASNGSCNPFIITNKEAHTIHGNPFFKSVQSKRTSNSQTPLSSCADHTYLVNTQRHFTNHCLDYPGKYSCAVDCFLEITNAVFMDFILNISRNHFFEMLFQTCVFFTDVNVRVDQLALVREPVWHFLHYFLLVKEIQLMLLHDVT